MALTWPDPETGKLVSRGLPFDQGVRDKMPHPQLDLLEDEDPNLSEGEWYELLAWLKRQKIVFHNAKFDLTMMRAGTRHWPGVDLLDQLHWDTMLVQGELDPTELRGLDVTCRRLGFEGKQGVDDLKGWLKQNKYPVRRYDLAPWSVAEPYVVGDTELTATLYLHQLERIRKLDEEDRDYLRRRIRDELQLLRTLYHMEQRGLGYDAERSIAAAEKLEQMADEIERGMPFKCIKSEGVRYFFGELGLTPDRRSEKTGAPALDEEQVRAWIKDGVPNAKEYADVTKMRRAVSMWYRGYPEKMGADGRLRCSFKQGHVKSGRMSVERVQLQALPKKDKNIDGVPGVRELLVPREGHGLWSLDLSQAELRVAAKYSGCKLMLQELASDDPDIHGKTNRQVLHVQPDDPLWKEKRDIAKRLTFGGIFQIGGETFQGTLARLADIHLPLHECNAMVAAWRAMYPEFGVAYRRAEQKAKRDGYVRLLPNTPLEMRSYFGPREWPNTAWNRIVQGSLAEAFKQLLIKTEEGWPGYLMLTIHDSVLLECPLDEGDQIAAEVAEMGAELMTDLFKIEMLMDCDRWDTAPDKTEKEDDQYQGVSGR